jgi:hypothetical protein
MRRVVADLHIHTVLSPCAAREMTPEAIVREAVRRGLGMIAICDHNSSGNVAAVRRAAGGELAAIAGIEVTTLEEVHLLGLFPDETSSSSVSGTILERLPFGTGELEQELYGEDGLPSGRERRMLVASSALELSAAVEIIHSHGGLAVAAHVDRRSFSVIGQLGFVPEDVKLDAAEISAAGVKRGRVARYAGLGIPLLSSSDAHSLEEIGEGSTVLEVAEASFRELVLALRGQGGRRASCA